MAKPQKQAPKQDQSKLLRTEANKRRRQAKHQRAVSTHKRLDVPRGTARAKRRAQTDWHAVKRQRREKREETGKVMVNGDLYGG